MLVLVLMGTSKICSALFEYQKPSELIKSTFTVGTIDGTCIRLLKAHVLAVYPIAFSMLFVNFSSVPAHFPLFLRGRTKAQQLCSSACHCTRSGNISYFKNNELIQDCAKYIAIMIWRYQASNNVFFAIVDSRARKNSYAISHFSAVFEILQVNILNSFTIFRNR